ncbi:MAG: hypothetical protein GXO49_03425, partial [Chlorobi bacterium]|nr:hypothetical protein [Chlorobiota bacterium]
MNKFLEQEEYNYKNTSLAKNDIVAKIIIQLKRLKKLNKAYSKNVDKNGIDFVNSVLEMLGVKCEVDDIDINRIPKKGPFILISNSPLGGIEGLLLLKLI